MIVSLGLFRDERGERHAKDRDSKAMAAFENKSVVLNSGYTAITRHIHSHAYMQLKTDKKALFHSAQLEKKSQRVLQTDKKAHPPHVESNKGEEKGKGLKDFKPSCIEEEQCNRGLKSKKPDFNLLFANCANWRPAFITYYIFFHLYVQSSKYELESSASNPFP